MLAEAVAANPEEAVALIGSLLFFGVWMIAIYLRLARRNLR